MFSTGVKLIGVDDFIAPSNECIKPVILPSKDDPKKSKSAFSATLADCLSCNGCITSSEAVFIEQQGLTELTRILCDDSNICRHKTVVFSISPQSLVSLMHRRQIGQRELCEKISTILRHDLYTNYIFHTSWANEITIKEMSTEFINFYKSSVVMDSHKAQFLLSGVCPGVVCYAEKVHAELLVPHLSRVRSPQAVIGSYVKRYLSLKLNKNPNEIFHVAVMPCFDRKLEAFRPDFLLDSSDQASHEVDHVLSSYEFDELISRYDTTPTADIGFNNHITLEATEFDLDVSLGNGSGGAAVNVFAHACKELFNVEVVLAKCDTEVLWTCNTPNYFVETVPSRRSDYAEWSLKTYDSSKPLLTFAQIYGFTNIQNMVNRVKKFKIGDEFPVFIEVMACPGRGCLNGGGQSSPGEKALQNITQKKSYLDALQVLYNSMKRYSTDSCRSKEIEIIYEEFKSNGINMSRELYPLTGITKTNIANW